MIILKCDEITLSDGSKVNIGTRFDSTRDIPKAVVKAVYEREISSGKSSNEAAMIAAMACGYETQNAVKKIVA